MHVVVLEHVRVGWPKICVAVGDGSIDASHDHVPAYCEPREIVGAEFPSDPTARHEVSLTQSSAYSPTNPEASAAFNWTIPGMIGVASVSKIPLPSKSEPTAMHESTAEHDTANRPPPPEPSLGATVEGVHDHAEFEKVPTE
jgi:hypothetical protein